MPDLCQQGREGELSRGGAGIINSLSKFLWTGYRGEWDAESLKAALKMNNLTGNIQQGL